MSFSVQANNTVDPQLVITQELRKQLTPSTNKHFKPTLDWPRLRAFYQSQGYNPVWLDKDGLLPRAALLRQVLNGAEQDGLVYEVYHPELISERWKAQLPWKLAELDLLLTDAFFRYSEHVQTGSRNPFLSEYYADISPPDIDPIVVLHDILKSEDFQTSLHQLIPSHEGYLRLRAALKNYREILGKGGWPVLPIKPVGPILTLGRSHEHVTTLRQRLKAEGDLILGPVKHLHYFDQPIKFAVERFQVRYGLAMDGIVGPKTRAVMNVPVKKRIKQIMLNMDRWRWLPRPLGLRYIMVNTAGFELAVVNNNVTQFTMGVIIGRPKRPTPIAKGILHTVVFNPHWTLPQTIVFEDIIPKQLRDQNYIKSKGIRIFTNRTNGEELDPAEIDWAQIDQSHFPYILRQDPGRQNPLGRLKFLFSNTYDVYLHDTPEQTLFDKNTRAFSSGCIRVKQPKQLARYLLGEQNGWTEEKIEAEIASGDYQEISVSGKVPVYLIYMTSWVGGNGGVHFRPDIYDWDPKGPKCDELP